MQIAGIVAAISLIVGISIYSGHRVKSASDFSSGGGKAGTPIIAGVIMGTLIGGSSTIGTAELAYNFGLSAWWFTLGGGLGCLLLGLFYTKRLRMQGRLTLTGMISDEFGPTADVYASILSSAGLFISIVTQILSAAALMAIIFPNMDFAAEVFTTVSFMAVYVVFGGVLGTGRAGIIKVILLCAAALSAGVIVLHNSSGMGGLFCSLDRSKYYSFFARGAWTDGGAALSLILGVLSTQTCAQAVISGKSDRDARLGALITSVLMPVIGAGGVLVGLFMRVNYPYLAEARLAFPQFIMDCMPPLLGGIVIGALIIAILGTGAGLTLGIVTVIDRDIAKRLTRRFDEPKKGLVFTRVCIITVLFAAGFFTLGPVGDTILDFAFMSMGLRAAVIFVPLTCALFFPGKVDRRFAIAAIIAGPACVLIFGTLFDLAFDPLFIGMGAAIILCLLGAVIKKNKA